MPKHVAVDVLWLVDDLRTVSEPHNVHGSTKIVQIRQVGVDASYFELYFATEQAFLKFRQIPSQPQEELARRLDPLTRHGRDQSQEYGFGFKKLQKTTVS